MKKKILIGALIGFTIIPQIWDHYQQNQSLESVISDINKECPVQMRPNITIFRYDYIAPDTMVLNYQLSRFSKDSIDVDALKQGLEPELRKDIGKSINTKLMPYSTINSVYRYYDRNKEFLFEIVISIHKPLPNEA